MKLVRVTQLEQFSKYLHDSTYVTEQSIFDSLSGEFRGNEYTRIGTAFHRIVEGDTKGCIKVNPETKQYGKDMIPVEGGRTFLIDNIPVTLSVSQCKVALAYKDMYPSAFHEIRLCKKYENVMVTGCADMVDGLEIRDIKTKFSNVVDSDYTDSMQWRFYLDMFRMDTFHFDLFCFQGYDKEKHGYDPRPCKLVKYEPAITCYRYDSMFDDLNYITREFMRYVYYRKLDSLLPEYSLELIESM